MGPIFSSFFKCCIGDGYCSDGGCISSDDECVYSNTNTFSDNYTYVTPTPTAPPLTPPLTPPLRIPRSVTPVVTTTYIGRRPLPFDLYHYKS